MSEEKAAPSTFDSDSLKLIDPSCDSASSLDESALPHSSILVHTQSDDDDEPAVVTATTNGSAIARHIRSTVSSLASTPRFLSSSSPRLRNFDYVDPAHPHCHYHHPSSPHHRH